MKKWMEKLKKLKKEQIFLLLLAGVLLLAAAMPRNNWEIGTSFSGNPEEKEQETMQEEPDTCEKLEEKLEQILTKVQGIGKVKVMITLKAGEKKIVEKDKEESGQEEKNSQDNQMVQTNSSQYREATVYRKDGSGGEEPYVSQEISPEIEGVLVIAQGGGNSETEAQITEAVMALFGVSAHKIKVMKME